MWRLFCCFFEFASERVVEYVALEISKPWSFMGTVPEMGRPVITGWPFCVVRRGGGRESVFHQILVDNVHKTIYIIC